MRSAISYLILLGLSQAWIAMHPPESRPAGDRQWVELARQDSRGEVEGPPVRVAYLDLGQGPVVIYLHGSPGSADDVLDLAPFITPGFRLIAPDLPGFGDSTGRLPDYGVRAHARYALALMEALGIDRAQIVAHSMGSGVAFCLADLAPDRVASITSYGGIGIQEGEGSGDYTFEHLKYALGYGLLVVVPEVVPHFGWLGSRSTRHAFIRNFWDTDQRPLRALIERLDQPLLLLHGRDDPLVPLAAAIEHHRLVPHSELVVLEASHFLVFSNRGARILAAEILPFLTRYSRSGVLPARRTVIAPSAPRTATAWAASLGWVDGRSPGFRMALLAVGTLVSQHVAPLVGGTLATGRRLNAFGVLVVCFLGIWAGDLALFRLGRWLGRGRLAPWIVRLFDRRVDRFLGIVLVVSRAIPGSRLLLLPVVGALGTRRAAFFLGSVVSAAFLATLLVVLGTSLPWPAGVS